MGTTSTYKSKYEKTKDFLERDVLRWSSDEFDYKVLDGGVSNFSTYYGAVEKTSKKSGEREVFAVIILVRFNRSQEYNFSYKAMDETEGPYQTKCPEKILKLLTPTNNKHANDWRKACWDRINDKKNRPKIEKDMVLEYGGIKYTVMRRLGRLGYEVISEQDGCQYRLKTQQATKSKII
jgi:hypothetical protein